MKYDPVLCMMVNDKRTVDDTGIGFVPKPGKTKIKGFFVNSEGKQFDKVFEDSYKLMDFAREVKKNGGKFIGSASVNDSQSVFDKAIRSCDSVKVVYSDALGDDHTFIKGSVEEAKKWIDSGKFPHGAAFNIKIDGVLYKKEAR